MGQRLHISRLVVVVIAFMLLLTDDGYGLFAQKPSASLDRFMPRKMKRAGIVGIQAASVSEGKLFWKGSFGVMNVNTRTPVNDSTLFLIASCSKPITALAVLILADQGRFELDDPIGKYLPFCPVNPHFPRDTITIRMLLAHVSSLRDNWEILDPLYTLQTGGDSPIGLEEFVTEWFTDTGRYYSAEKNYLNSPPAQKWEYCNMGYVLLGYLIEKVSGRSFTDYMQNEIFVPLSMHRSWWMLSDIPDTNIARPHVLHDKKSGKKGPTILPHYGYPDFPDGQLRTSVSDYSLFVGLLLSNGKLGDKVFLTPEMTAEFLRVQYPGINRYQAIAWNYNEFENRMYYLLMPRLPSHTGGDPGVATVVSFDPEKHTGAIVFINSPPITFRGGKIFYLDIVRRLLKEAERQ